MPEVERLGRRTNLTLQLTSFVGRDRQIVELTQRLADVRMLTLTGAGGVAKTRLALRIADKLLETTSDSVWLAELSAFRDPRLVPEAVAVALDVRQRPAESLEATLVEAIVARELVLVLDNLPAPGRRERNVLQPAAA